MKRKGIKKPECKEREAESRIEDQTEKEGKGDGKVEVEEEMETRSEEEQIHRPKKHKAVILIEEEVNLKKGKKRVSLKESREEEEEKREPEERAAKGNAKKRAPASHHLSRKCVVGHRCTYEGPNLKRHLRNVQVAKKHIVDEQVDKYFAMGLEGHRRRGPPVITKAGKKSKGRWKR